MITQHPHESVMFIDNDLYDYEDSVYRPAIEHYESMSDRYNIVGASWASEIIDAYVSVYGYPYNNETSKYYKIIKHYNLKHCSSSCDIEKYSTGISYRDWKAVIEWCSDNFKSHDFLVVKLITMGNIPFDVYFGCGEDLMAFKLRWL